jgi:hypothetical protein
MWPQKTQALLLPLRSINGSTFILTESSSAPLRSNYGYDGLLRAVFKTVVS